MGVVDNFKELFKLAETVNNLELYKQLSSLQSRVMEVEEDNRRLGEELRATAERLKIRERLAVRDNAYYLLNPESQESDGPFCMRCWDVDGKLVRERVYSDGTHSCLQCHTLRVKRV